MIAVLLAMVRARSAPALVGFALSALVIAATVAGPVALRAANVTIAQDEVEAATDAERSLSITSAVDPSAQDGAAALGQVSALLDVPGLEPIRAGELRVFGPSDDGSTTRLVFRDRVCLHLVVVAGRCFAGPLEVVVGEDVARRTGLRPGDVATVQAARRDESGELVADGAAASVAVTGIYRPRDLTEAYWAGRDYFPPAADGTRQEVVFATVQTFDLVEHTQATSTVDLVATDATLAADQLARLAEQAARVREQLSGGPFVVSTGLDALASRVEQEQREARQLVPVAFLPLVALCFLVLYLAVGQSGDARRPETALLLVRGLSPAHRWWLATGETALAVLAGSLVGYPLGYVVVGLGDRSNPGLDADAAPIALATLALALVVVGTARWRAGRASVLSQLRGIAAAGKHWRAGASLAAVSALAAVATIQSRTSSAKADGVALLAPLLLMVATVVALSHALGPVSALVARRALRRGRLAAALAALALIRRPGGQRLFGLVALACALFCFVAAGVGVATTSREERAMVATGAPTVATVDVTEAGQVLQMTHLADPHGAWAMAVVPVPQADDTRVLAVDSSRLAAVATWRPEFGPSVADVAAALMPPAPRPFLVRAGELSLDVENFRRAGQPAIDLEIRLEPLDASGGLVVSVPDLSPGRATRIVAVPRCADGCRLTGFAIRSLRTERLRLAVHGITAVDPRPGSAPVVARADLVDLSQWRASPAVQLSTSGGALELTATTSAFTGTEVAFAAVDAPLPVPVVSPGNFGDDPRIASVDGELVPITSAGPVAGLPRLGANGVLVDLDYLVRTSLFAARQGPAEVWLGPAAPADAVDQLRSAGLTVRDVTRLDEIRTELGRKGSAISLRYHMLAAVIALLLALTAMVFLSTVDRNAQATELGALRVQGLTRSAVRAVAVRAYPAIGVLAAVAGLGAAAVAWLAVGDRLPFVTAADDGLRPPRWPELSAVAGPWLVITACVGGVGAVIAAELTRAVRHRGEGRR